MRVEILGPVRVTVGSDRVEITSRAERALLVALALHVGRPVSLDQLSTALWGDAPPTSGTKSLRSHLSRLRSRLGSDVARPVRGGYRMALAREDTDLGELEGLLSSGRTARSEGDVTAQRVRFARAESLWRGEPLEDLADCPERTAYLEHIRGLRREAQEGRLRADLDAGQPGGLVNELQSLVAEEPTREPLWGLLMLAQYRSGRQIDALRTYEQVRTLLSQEWGVDPSSALQRLRWQILRQDPQLDRVPPPPPMAVPAPLTPFVGRVGQVDEVAAALEENRLVTLHGPAGVGKSRLAAEVARAVRLRFGGGVWWVDLTATSDGIGALDRIAESVGVVAAPGVSVAQAVAHHLAHRELLLVLDNCEHVVDPLGPIVLRVLERAPGVRVLATSRAFLQVSGESRWDVPPLSVPPAGAGPQEVLKSEAVMLFQQRRGRHLADVEPNTVGEVGQLCRALDGVPLALELAAARTQGLTVHELHQRLVAEVMSVARQKSIPAHHASLSSAIDWSYGLLQPRCQHLLDWLSVFHSDFDQAAVEAVGVGIPTATTTTTRRCLAELVDSSLVESRTAGEQTRYRLLFVIREFAAAKLAERGETDAAWQVFTDHYRGLAGHAAAELNGAQSGKWLRRVTQEMANLRAAVDWSLAHEPPCRTVGFVPAVGRVSWGLPSKVAAELARLRSIVEPADAAGADAQQLGWAWHELATASYLTGDLAYALHACDRAEELLHQANDQTGLAAVHWHRGATHLLGAGDLAAAEGDLRRGRTLALQAGAVVPEAWCNAHLVQLHCLASATTQETLGLQDRAAEIADPDDDQMQSHLVMNQAFLHLAQGNLEACLRDAQRCEEHSREHGQPNYEQAGVALQATALLAQGSADAARPIALRAAQMALDTGNRMQFGVALQPLAGTAELHDHDAQAARLWGASRARTPVWPLLAPYYEFAQARHALGASFAEEEAHGSALSDEQALTLAIG